MTEMLFTTADQRSAYFTLVESDPGLIFYGAALSHANATVGSVWGSEQALLDDCARLMRAEVLKCAIDTGVCDRSTVESALHSGIPGLPSIQEVMQAQTFRLAIQQARGRCQRTLQGKLAKEGIDLLVANLHDPSDESAMGFGSRLQAFELARNVMTEIFQNSKRRRKK